MQQASSEAATKTTEDKSESLLATSLSNMSHSIESVQKSLTEPKASDTLLAESLQMLSANLSTKTSTQKTTSEEIVLQLSRLVDGMKIMNRELEEVSEASQEKAKWFTRLTKKDIKKDL